MSPSFFMSTGLLQNKDPRSFPYKQSSHVGKRFPSPDCRSSAPPQKHTETLVKFGKKLVLHGFAGIHFVDSIQYLKKSLSGQKRSRVFFLLHSFGSMLITPTNPLRCWANDYLLISCFSQMKVKNAICPHIEWRNSLTCYLKPALATSLNIYIKKFEASLPAQQLPFQTCGPWASLMLA